MTEVKKHREFEIFYHGHSGTIAVRNVKDAVGMHRNDDDEYIDLIEISAVKELEDEIENLNKLLDKAVEALESQPRYDISVNPPVETHAFRKAYSALAEIKEGRK